MKGYTFRIDGIRLHFFGVDFGSVPHLIARSENHIVMRVPAHTAWASVGETKNYPSSWRLFRFKQAEKDKFKVVELVREEEPGRHWKKCKESMIADMWTAEKNLGGGA